MTNFHAIIPAGGAGTRLWPLSRRNAPKFLADLTGTGRTLIQQTADRLQPLTGDNVLVVTGTAHAEKVAAQLPQLGEHNIIAEPSPRDSMAAIGLAAAVIGKRHGNVVVGSFAADHLIKDENAFRTAVAEAIKVAQRGYVVTIGITPDYPATGFGYIHSDVGFNDPELPTAMRVTKFFEKPDAQTAAGYLAAGNYRWNAGMFLFTPDTLLAALERFEPELHAGIVEIAEAWDTPQRAEVLARVWPTLKKIAIDHAIAEPLADLGGVGVVPVDMGWNDVGDYASLRDVLPESDHLNRVAPGGAEQLVIADNSPGALVYTHSKPIIVEGVPDAVVVETADAIFVTTRAQTQNVKRVVDELSAAGREDLR